jgi:hypothetical protein
MESYRRKGNASSYAQPTRRALIASITSWLFLNACGSGALAGAAPAQADQPPAIKLPQGAWRDPGDPRFGLLIEGQTIWSFQNGEPQRAVQIFKGRDGGLRACPEGREVALELEVEGDNLTLKDPWRGELRRLEREPASTLKPVPFPLPAPRPFTLQETEAVQGEISQRQHADLELQQQPSAPSRPPSWQQPAPAWNPALAENVTANRKFLRQLVSRVGWIDAGRFGYGAAFRAELLLLHSLDAAMMMAALPVIQKDVEEGRLFGDSYALVYDKLQILLGKKQRFASQVDYDAQSRPYLRPTEQPETADERRAQWGLVPLAQYIAVFGGTEVRFSPDCAELEDSL